MLHKNQLYLKFHRILSQDVRGAISDSFFYTIERVPRLPIGTYTQIQSRSLK